MTHVLGHNYYPAKQSGHNKLILETARGPCWPQTSRAKNTRVQATLCLCFGSHPACLIIFADNLGYTEFFIGGSDPARACIYASLYDRRLDNNGG